MEWWTENRKAASDYSISPSLQYSPTPSSLRLSWPTRRSTRRRGTRLGRPPAYHALAEMDCRRADLGQALEHLDRSLRLNADNSRARNLKAIVLRKLGRATEADALLRETLALDPLDWWARHLSGEPARAICRCVSTWRTTTPEPDFIREAIALLDRAVAAPPGDLPNQSWGAAPLVYYTLGWLQRETRRHQVRPSHFTARGGGTRPTIVSRRGWKKSPSWKRPSGPIRAMPARRTIWATCSTTAAATTRPSALGTRRELDPKFPIVWRNLGIGYFNIVRQPANARAAYERAFRAEPDSRPAAVRARPALETARRNAGETAARTAKTFAPGPSARRSLRRTLRACTTRPAGTPRRWNSLFAQLPALGRRRRRPARPIMRTHLVLGRDALARGDAAGARRTILRRRSLPANLGEAKHLLANQSDIHYWLGVACMRLATRRMPHHHWRQRRDFQGRFSGDERPRLQRNDLLLRPGLDSARQESESEKAPSRLAGHALASKDRAKIDYFATSLAAMLLFDDDLQSRQDTTALFLRRRRSLVWVKPPAPQALPIVLAATRTTLWPPTCLENA